MRAPYSRTMFDLLCEQAERYPDRAAVICDDTRITYSQLHDRAARVAAGLRHLGLGPHDQVGLLLNNRTEWLEICFGTAAIGAVLVPFSTWSKRRELDFLFKDSQIKALFAAAMVGDQDFAKHITALLPAMAPGAWRDPQFAMLANVVFIGGGPGAGGKSRAKYA